MKLIYLIRGAKARDRFLVEPLPDGVTRSIKPYGNQTADEMNLVRFECSGNSIGTAKMLAKLRDGLPGKSNSHLIEDGPSSKFCTTLFPLFARYERELRKAITLAVYSEAKNFSDRIVNKLGTYSLNDLGAQLFYDGKFKHDLGNLLDRKQARLSKDDLLDEIQRLDEKTVWDDIFPTANMDGVRNRYDRLSDIRNDVMHHHVVSVSVYEEARRLLHASITELQQYTLHQMEDKEYVEEQAGKALAAAQRLGSNYAALISEMGGLALPIPSLSDSISKLADVVNLNPITDATRRALARSEALAAATKAITESSGLTNSLTDDYKTPAMAQFVREIQLRDSNMALLAERVKMSAPALELPTLSQIAFDSIGNSAACSNPDDSAGEPYRENNEADEDGEN